MKTNFICLHFLLIFIGFHNQAIVLFSKSINQYSFININVSCSWFDQSEHSHCQTWFSCSCSSDNSNFLSTSNRTLNLFEYQRKSVTISQTIFFEVHFTLKNLLEQGLILSYPKDGKFLKLGGVETLSPKKYRPDLSDETNQKYPLELREKFSKKFCPLGFKWSH